MGGVYTTIPVGTIHVIAVFGQSSQVADTKIAAARRPVGVIGRGLAQIVVASPHKLADNPAVVILHLPVVVGQIAPRAILGVVTRTLAVGIGIVVVCPYPYRELVYSARAHGRCRLRPEQKTLGQLCHIVVILVNAVVETRHIHHLGET